MPRGSVLPDRPPFKVVSGYRPKLPSSMSKADRAKVSRLYGQMHCAMEKWAKQNMHMPISMALEMGRDFPSEYYAATLGLSKLFEKYRTVK